MSTTPIEVKIALLLAKAEGSDNEHEREEFSRKAEELMIKHGVELADAMAAAQPTRAARENIIRHVVRCTGSLRMCEFQAYVDLAYGTGWAKSFNLKNAYDRNAQSVLLVGFEADVARLVQLAESIVAQCDAACKQWWAENREAYLGAEKDAGWYARRSFKYGFSQAVGIRLKAMLQDAIQETGSALAVRDRGALVEDWVNGNMSVSNGRTSRMKAEYQGQNAGRSAGAKATLHSGELN